MRIGQVGGSESQSLHDLEGGVGVVGGVEELVGGEVGGVPIAGGDGAGFAEGLLEDFGDGAADADLVLVAAFAEGLVEVENVVEGDAEAVADLAVVVFQAEADFENALGGEEVGNDGDGGGAIELENVGAVGEGKLDDVRAGALLASAEGGAGFGVEACYACGKDVTGGGFAFGLCVGDVDAVVG